MAGADTLLINPGLDAEAWAKLHAAAFASETPRPWSQAAFAAADADPNTDGISACGTEGELLGVALVRTLFEDSELLTLAVAPDQRREGIGAALLRAAEAVACRRGAERMLLEVEAEAHPALALYAAFGYTQMGHRRAYYIDRFGRAHDAQILSKLLTELD